MSARNIGEALTLQGNRVTVREFRESDLTEFTRYRSMPDVARFQSWSEYSIEQAQAMFAAMSAVAFGSYGHWFQVAICARGEERLLGDLAVHFIDAHQVEIGFTLAPANQSLGLAHEAVSLLLNYLFTECHYHRVIAVTDCLNKPAYQLLERLHFRRESHWIENIFFKGAWGSEYQYAILAREWCHYVGQNG